jgi:hypothetical protein
VIHAQLKNLAAAFVCCVAIVAGGGFAQPAGAATLSCSSSATLEQLVECVSLQMPQDASNGYVAPTSQQLSDFRSVFAQMLAGNCGMSLPSSLSTRMRLRNFQDSGNGRAYCVLMEVADNDNDGYVDRGWGTFITYANAVREVMHQAPHPKLTTQTSGSLGDAYTESEAVRVFKRSDSRSFGMCGARRGANTSESSCQPDHRSSDCAHNTNNMLHASTQQLLAHHAGEDFTVIQWHGMGAGTCQETAYISHGYSTNPVSGAKVTAVRNAARTELPGWTINTPSTSCTLNATDNVQGRLLNSVSAGSVCTRAASSSGYRNRFVHIEQDVPELGADLAGVSAAWARAITAALPEASLAMAAPLAAASLRNTAVDGRTKPVAPPQVPQGLQAIANAQGSASISLKWAATAGATHYNVERFSSAVGTFAVIAAGLAEPRFTDTGLKAGVMHHYRVVAGNASGASAASALAAAQAR